MTAFNLETRPLGPQHALLVGLALGSLIAGECVWLAVLIEGSHHAALLRDLVHLAPLWLLYGAAFAAPALLGWVAARALAPRAGCHAWLFAPVLPCQAEADSWFEGCRPTPYMTMTFDVKPPKRALVPAITHVDGTARVQTVGRAESPLYHRLISEFERRTGVPMLLNTSLNVRGQPIVAEPRTALGLFYSTGLAGLALGPYYLRK